MKKKSAIKTSTIRKSAMIMLFILSAFLFTLTFASFASAEVGVGISPAKITMQIEGGKTQELSLLVFNSGDKPMDITMAAEGDITPFVEVEPKGAAIEPEPRPLAKPIKNGVNFNVKIRPPALRETKIYTGVISAMGSPAQGTQLGGSVGVATQIELTVTPPPSVFAFVTATHLLIAAAALILIMLILLLKRSGFRLKLVRK